MLPPPPWATSATASTTRLSPNLIRLVATKRRLFILPDLIRRIWDREIDPGRVFDLELPLEQAAEGYRAMDERRAIKALLRP